MRICLVISALSAGGAERVLSLMANHWAVEGKDVTLITLDSDTSDFYTVDPRVKRVGLDVMNVSAHLLAGVLNNVRRLWVLRQAIGRASPDVVISFMVETNVLVVLASRGLGIGVIVSERVDPSRHPVGLIWSRLRKLAYRQASRVVVQSEQVRQWFATHVRTERLTIIPNPVSRISAAQAGDGALTDVTGVQSRRNTVIAMGRLTRQKGFDLLLKAFAHAIQGVPEWQLVVLGDGEERAALEQLSETLGVSDKVFFAGRVQAPQALMRQAQLFVLSSRYEGFPNALLEAMACALPVISFDCPSGPREIIDDGVDGVLVPAEDAEALACTMTMLMCDRSRRGQLAAQAARVVDRFGIDHVMALWDEVIEATIARR